MNPIPQRLPRILLAIFLMAVLVPLPATHADAAVVPNTVQHPGTRINLFDYWVTQQAGRDDLPAKDNPSTLTDGINGPLDGEATQLKFSKNMGGAPNTPSKISANIWTGNPSYGENGRQPRTGIVKNILEGGYPVTRIDNNDTDTGITAEQSLAYLFDPSLPANGKASYSNVSGLLMQDENGYYYYDCTKNFAEFHEAQNAFVLHDQPAVWKVNSSEKGQFFPFNNFEAVTKGNIHCEDEAILHYLGLSMITRFVQLPGGLTYNGKAPVTYEFSGDDDVWIFIDDVLVVDLGGIHDAISFKIDFASGDIFINSENVYTIRGQFQKAGRESQAEWNGNTFANDTYHTMKFFYLERGNGQSNLSLKFNLAEVPETYVYKVDQQGNPVEGAEFALYAADENYQIKGKAPICQNKTDEKGRLVFLTEDDMPLAIKELANKSKHFVLREVRVPDGYRAETPDIRLYIHEGANGASLLLADDIWGSGAYAVPSVTVRATNEIYQFNRDNPTTKGNPISEAELANGTMFAVAFVYDESRASQSGAPSRGDEANWYPVSGNQLKGWTVHDNKALNAMENIIEAAKATPNVFALLSDGAMGCRVDEVPGDSKLYYYMLKEDQKNQSKYTYGFYFTAGKLEDATAGNTRRLYGDSFLREFSAHIYVPDMINTLYVKKTDTNGNALPGASFALYRKEAAAGGTAWNLYYTATTGANGFASFPNNAANNPNGKAILEKGVYRLAETAAPGGYLKNTAASFNPDQADPGGIPVIVNEYGVFVDAGMAGDGVTVRKQAGRIVRTMLHFAISDQLNHTLKDISVSCQTASTYPENIGQLPNVAWQNGNGQLHLTYEGKAILEGYVQDYLPTVANAPAYLETDTGYLRLQIRQDYGTGDAARLKEPLGDTDLTQLFSIATTVVVANEHNPADPTRTSLTVSKLVTGENADTQKPFAFTVTLDDRSVSGTYGGMTVNNGVATFMLKHGESLTAIGLPETGYTVAEAQAEGYKVTAENAAGKLEKGKPVTALFQNERTQPGASTSPSPSPTVTVSPSPSASLTPTVTASPSPSPAAAPPKTGDSNRVMLWLALALAAAGCLAGIALYAAKPPNRRAKNKPRFMPFPMAKRKK